MTTDYQSQEYPEDREFMVKISPETAKKKKTFGTTENFTKKV